MTKDEIRLECLRLALPGQIAFPDLERVLKQAAAYVRFIEDNGSAALVKMKADIGVTSEAASPDTAKAPGKTRRQKQTA